MESNDSPEISDRGETSDIPDLPSGAGQSSDRLNGLTLHMKSNTHYDKCTRTCRVRKKQTPPKTTTTTTKQEKSSWQISRQ